MTFVENCPTGNIVKLKTPYCMSTALRFSFLKNITLYDAEYLFQFVLFNTLYFFQNSKFIIYTNEITLNVYIDDTCT